MGGTPFGLLHIIISNSMKHGILPERQNQITHAPPPPRHFTPEANAPALTPGVKCRTMRNSTFRSGIFCHWLTVARLPKHVIENNRLQTAPSIMQGRRSGHQQRGKIVSDTESVRRVVLPEKRLRTTPEQMCFVFSPTIDAICDITWWLNRLSVICRIVCRKV